MTHILVEGDKCIKLCLGESEQFSVLLAAPTLLRDRRDFKVRLKEPAEPPVNVLVKQNTYYGAASKASFAISRNATACSRRTDGNPARNSSRLSPASR
jgi:hypothetical protein